MKTRYPGVFYSKDRTQRIGVALYKGQPELTFSWMLENKPGGAWIELEMEASEAEAFANTILHRVSASREQEKADG